MAAEASRSAGPADSYIGSLISLTSKSEIRYEGVLYNINTDESSIGLRNVRSFGTEGRKKDGPQVPPSDKVYEYILFRGSDIKDLQVKASPPPPAPAPPPIHNDPAIIQSHFSRPPPVASSMPVAGSGPVTDLNSHTSQMGLPRSTFQGALPLYQPGGSMGSWGSTAPPPNANGGGLAMPPMYWQGFYGPPSGLPQLQQQSLIRPPPGLTMPHSLQQPMQYSGMNPSLPTGASNLPVSTLPAPSLTTPNLQESHPPLLAPVSSNSLNIAPTTATPTLPSTLAPTNTAALASEPSPSLMPAKAPSATLPTVTPTSSLPLVSPLTTASLEINVIAPSTSNKPKPSPGPPLPYQTSTHSVPATAGIPSIAHTEASAPPLVTPGQLLQPASTAPSSSQQSQQPLRKDVEVVQASASSSSSSEPVPAAPAETQAPILPLPSPSDRRLNGPSFYNRYGHGNRGRERGRGNGVSRPVTKFTEDFDFMAMNEKFKKDEVWGHLGKGSRSQDDEDDDSQDEGYAESLKNDSKPVYVKDDFFDTLSCNALDRESRNGRMKFSEQMKIDTETFGDFPRHRGGRGGRGPGRGGGGRTRGGYYGRGYGYVGRGRGYGPPNRANY
ncbi:hypothetical protein Scep_022407 [Stephania cephalantha]|uniref:Protein decapping 5 n=1 Tax=Stephania cephalantha TaxID=152367 RepID=A0AAP0FEZ8_9MAGN